MRIQLLVLVCLACFSSCVTEEKSDKSSLPESIGGSKKILLVAETDFIESSVGDSLMEVFNTPYPGLIGEESYCSVNKISPQKFNDLYKTQRIIVVPIILDGPDYFQKVLSQEVIAKVSSGDLFILEKRDVWAQNQFVYFLVAPTVKDFKEQLFKEKEELLKLVDNSLVESLLVEMKIKNRSDSLEKLIVDKGLEIVIPEKYLLAKDTVDFLWLRSYRKDADLNLIISSRAYESESQFSPKSLIEFRDSVCSLIFVDPVDTASFMVTETYLAPVFSSLKTTNGYTKKMNGLWRINNFRLGGGSFVSYTFLNPAKTRQYYVEGFVFAPQKEKIQYLRKLDATLKSITFLKKKS